MSDLQMNARGTRLRCLWAATAATVAIGLFACRASTPPGRVSTTSAPAESPATEQASAHVPTDREHVMAEAGVVVRYASSEWTPVPGAPAPGTSLKHAVQLGVSVDIGIISGSLGVTPNLLMVLGKANLTKRYGSTFILHEEGTRSVGSIDSTYMEVSGTADGASQRWRSQVFVHGDNLIVMTFTAPADHASLGTLERTLLGAMELRTPAKAPTFLLDESLKPPTEVTVTAASAKLTYDAAAKQVTVQARMSFRHDVTTESLASLQLALPGPVRLVGVTLDGAAVADAAWVDSTLTVPLSTPMAVGARADLTINYVLELAGMPEPSFFAAAALDEAFLNYDWFPKLGKHAVYGAHPSAPGLTLELVAPAGWQAVAPGVIRGALIELGAPAAIAPLVAFGNYRRLDFTFSKRPVHVYLLPDDAPDHAEALARLFGEGYTLFEKWFGDLRPRGAKDAFPVRLVSSHFPAIRGFPYLIFAGKKAGVFAHALDAAREIDPSNTTTTGLMLHEMSHSWWGNARPFSLPGALFQAEALANYSALLAVRELRGDEAYRAMLAHLRAGYGGIVAAKGDVSLLNDDAGPSGAPIAYTKGALMLARLQQDFPRLDLKRVLRTYAASKREDAIAVLLELLAAGTKKTPEALKIEYFELLDNPALLAP
ncbi:MAG: hypothetical protein IPL79_01380 [Myxococcales bacterium]|nr:hypothetical protein [Myxococcales bacterium]